MAENNAAASVPVMTTTYKKRFNALSEAGLIIEKYRTNGSIELICTVCGELYDRERGEGRASCVRDRTAISTHIANNHQMAYERAMERAEPPSCLPHESDGLSEYDAYNDLRETEAAERADALLLERDERWSDEEG